MTMVDLINDFKMTGKELLHQWNRPFLERLWKYSVVGVPEYPGGYIPGSIPTHSLKSQQEVNECAQLDKIVD